jgi:hypothetical protein
MRSQGAADELIGYVQGLSAFHEQHLKLLDWQGFTHEVALERHLSSVGWNSFTRFRDSASRLISGKETCSPIIARFRENQTTMAFY